MIVLMCGVTAEGIDENGLVELQGVGGTALMIEADLIREGLIFPTFPFRHAIETEVPCNSATIRHLASEPLVRVSPKSRTP